MKTTDKPTLQSYHIDGIKHIHPHDALEEMNNGSALMIDVRDEMEIKMEHIPLEGIIYIPMSEIMNRLAELPREKDYIVACSGGVRSAKIVELLRHEGYAHIANLDGGLMNWKDEGFPFELKEISMAVGCGCRTKPATPEKNSLLSTKTNQKAAINNIKNKSC